MDFIIICQQFKLQVSNNRAQSKIGSSGITVMSKLILCKVDFPPILFHLKQESVLKYWDYHFQRESVLEFLDYH